MGVETERKFLVRPGWRETVVRTLEVRQGYLSEDPARAVRVRITDGRSGALTVKGPREGARRPEFEYPVPLADATEILARLCPQPLVEKVRHYLGAPYDGWTVDEFYGSNAGLVLAELDSEEAEFVTDLPPWIVAEVTTDLRFDNARLHGNPYPGWAPAARTAPAAPPRSPADAGLVIFDNDGVLVDSEPLANRVLAALLTESGFPTTVEESIRRYMGGTLDRVRDMLRADTGRELPADFAQRYREWLKDVFERELRPVPGITDVLDALAERGTPFCVASSSPRDRLELALRVTGLAPRLGHRVYSADEVLRGKPAPDLFLHAAVRMGVDPADAVVVEDSVPGVDAATAAGMTGIGFAALTPADRLSRAAYVVHDTAGLAARLGLPADVPV
ncbi:HAD-IA family hydrolase [Streptomyces sp. NPDC093982]|jgi:HAD superfamily hydrolase (TIGR01509 family)|uniref:HAD-IA family hydrolase n=1 Tax=Streptomyces sp. NPDC093982 TaxID=3155077 RepID=UPI003449E371